MSPHVFLVAGEESGDRLGAALISAIRDRTQGKAHFSCVGGAHMAAEGVPSLFPLGDLAIVGFSSIPAMLSKILRRIREAADAVIAAKPDVLVIIDSPEFTHRVARRVRERASGIPIVDYVCPSVWAWRPGRARAMRTYVDHVLALLPFEPEAMNDLGGPPCTFVGHPLSERLVDLRPNELEAPVTASGSPSGSGFAWKPHRRNSAHGAGIRPSDCSCRRTIWPARGGRAGCAAACRCRASSHCGLAHSGARYN